MDKLLITGGSGLLALNWAMAVRERLSVVLGVHRRIVSLPSVQSQHIDLDSVDRLTAQLEAAKTDLVIHAAGLTNIEQCEANPDLAWHVNVVTAENIAKACNRLGIPLVHISSDHLFSGEGSMATEESSPCPVNVYGRTKVEAELRVLKIFPTALVIRTNFYGWGTTYRQSFSDMVIDRLRAGNEITLFEDVHYTPILAESLAFAVHDLIDWKAAGIFNVVGDDRFSKYDFGLRLAAQFGLDGGLIKPGLIGEREGLMRRPLDMSLSNRKVSEFLGHSMGGVVQHIGRLFQQEQFEQARELKSL